MIRAMFVAAGVAMLSLPALAAPAPAPATPAAAATQDDAQAALTAARAAEAEAVAAKAAWIPTETDLTKAQKALDDGNWDAAKAAADEALTLAKRSVEQANEEKTLWHLEVFH